MDAAGAVALSQNGFRLVGQELWRRTSAPSGQFVFWVYFLLCVTGLGGLGLWVELVQLHGSQPAERNWNNVYTALVTFFPALIGSSCVQMIFETKNRRMQAFAIVCCFAAFVFGLWLISAHRPATGGAWFASTAASIFSLWIWWISNADNRALHDEPSGDAAVGGDPEAALGGDFGGIEV